MSNRIRLYTVEEREQFGLPDTVSESPDTVSGDTLIQSHRKVGRSLMLIQEYVAKNDGVTRLEIAAAIKRKKTPHLIELIEHLVEVGILRKSCERHSGITGVQYVYRLA